MDSVYGVFPGARTYLDRESILTITFRIPSSTASFGRWHRLDDGIVCTMASFEWWTIDLDRGQVSDKGPGAVDRGRIVQPM